MRGNQAQERLLTCFSILNELYGTDFPEKRHLDAKMISNQPIFTQAMVAADRLIQKSLQVLVSNKSKRIGNGPYVSPERLQSTFLQRSSWRLGLNQQDLSFIARLNTKMQQQLKICTLDNGRFVFSGSQLNFLPYQTINNVTLRQPSFEFQTKPANGDKSTANNNRDMAGGHSASASVVQQQNEENNIIYPGVPFLPSITFEKYQQSSFLSINQLVVHQSQCQAIRFLSYEHYKRKILKLFAAQCAKKANERIKKGSQQRIPKREAQIIGQVIREISSQLQRLPLRQSSENRPGVSRGGNELSKQSFEATETLGKLAQSSIAHLNVKILSEKINQVFNTIGQHIQKSWNGPGVYQRDQSGGTSGTQQMAEDENEILQTMNLLQPLAGGQQIKKQKHFLPDETPLYKYSIVFALHCLRFKSKSVVIRYFPVRTSHFITQLLTTLSAWKALLSQPENQNYIIYVPGEQVSIFADSLARAFSQGQYCVCAIDSKWQRSIQTNVQSGPMAHEGFYYHSYDERVRFNFFGIQPQQQRQGSTVKLDQKVQIIIIAYEAINPQTDCSRQIRRFCQDNKLEENFSLGIFVHPERFRYLQSCDSEQRLIINGQTTLSYETDQELNSDCNRSVCELGIQARAWAAEIVAGLNVADLNGGKYAALYSYLDSTINLLHRGTPVQDQLLLQLYQQIQQLLYAVQYVPPKEIVQQSLPQPKFTNISLSGPIYQDKIGLFKEALKGKQQSPIFEAIQYKRLYKEVIMGHVTSQVARIDKLLRLVVSNAPGPGPASQLNVAACLREDPSRFVLNAFVKWITDGTIRDVDSAATYFQSANGSWKCFTLRKQDPEFSISSSTKNVQISQMKRFGQFTRDIQCISVPVMQAVQSLSTEAKLCEIQAVQALLSNEVGQSKCIYNKKGFLDQYLGPESLKSCFFGQQYGLIQYVESQNVLKRLQQQLDVKPERSCFYVPFSSTKPCRAKKLYFPLLCNHEFRLKNGENLVSRRSIIKTCYHRAQNVYLWFSSYVQGIKVMQMLLQEEKYDYLGALGFCDYAEIITSLTDVLRLFITTKLYETNQKYHRELRINQTNELIATAVAAANQEFQEKSLSILKLYQHIHFNPHIKYQLQLMEWSKLVSKQSISEENEVIQQKIEVGPREIKKVWPHDFGFYKTLYQRPEVRQVVRLVSANVGTGPGQPQGTGDQQTYQTSQKQTWKSSVLVWCADSGESSVFGPLLCMVLPPSRSRRSVHVSHDLNVQRLQHHQYTTIVLTPQLGEQLQNEVIEQIRCVPSMCAMVVYVMRFEDEIVEVRRAQYSQNHGVLTLPSSLSNASQGNFRQSGGNSAQSSAQGGPVAALAVAKASRAVPGLYRRISRRRQFQQLLQMSEQRRFASSGPGTTFGRQFSTLGNVFHALLRGVWNSRFTVKVPEKRDDILTFRAHEASVSQKVTQASMKQICVFKAVPALYGVQQTMQGVKTAISGGKAQQGYTAQGQTYDAASTVQTAQGAVHQIIPAHSLTHGFPSSPTPHLQSSPYLQQYQQSAVNQYQQDLYATQVVCRLKRIKLSGFYGELRRNLISKFKLYEVLLDRLEPLSQSFYVNKMSFTCGGRQEEIQYQQSVPLILSRKQNQRHFIASCCVYNNVEIQLLHMIQDASKATAERQKCKINSIFYKDLQQINYFQINFCVYQNFLQRQLHQDVKNLIFLSQVLKRPNNPSMNVVSQRPSQLNIMTQFVQTGPTCQEKLKQVRYLFFSGYEKQFNQCAAQKQRHRDVGRFAAAIFARPTYAAFHQDFALDTQYQAKTFETLQQLTRDVKGDFLAVQIQNPLEQLTDAVTQCLQQNVQTTETSDWISNLITSGVEAIVQNSTVGLASVYWLARVLRTISIKSASQIGFNSDENCFVNSVFLGYRNIDFIKQIISELSTQKDARREKSSTDDINQGKIGEEGNSDIIELINDAGEPNITLYG